MLISAAFERWQPGIASPLDVSQYAVGPSASTRDELLFVLPAQRPASPEIAESPTATTAGAPTPGPSAKAGAAPTAERATAASRTGRSFLVDMASVVRQPCHTSQLLGSVASSSIADRCCSSHASARSATSRQPRSTVSEWPRSGNSTSSVTALEFL